MGFILKKQNRSHIRLIKGPLKVPVSNRKTVLLETLQDVPRQANVAVEEFHEVL